MMSSLHFEVLPESQLQIWKKLKLNASQLDSFGFYLAGGTALALQLGHRRSVDFDFFSQKKAVAEGVHNWLGQFSQYILRDMNADTVHAELDGVKLSFIGAYKYPAIETLLEADKVKIASIADIGLMKLLAITHRATLRDYIDLAAIIRDHVALTELLKKSKQKYGDSFNTMLPLKALVSFDDIDTEMPFLIDKDLSSSWKDILKRAVKKVV